MNLRSLYLHHFRNYKEARFTFGPRLNIIHGANAQGKTSLLEGLYTLMTGSSFRANQHSELLKQGCSSFHLECRFAKYDIEQKLSFAYDGKDRRIVYNSTPLQAASGLLGLIPGVVMTPDDVQLVKGSPPLRRQFLDLQIAQTDPLYVHHLTRYHRAMRQRNRLLKARESLTIASWEHEMSHSAAYITMQRSAAVNELKSRCQGIHQRLVGDGEPLDIEYKGQIPLPSSFQDIQRQFLDKFYRHRAREMLMGFTLTGPHKDDLVFTLGGKDVRHFASEGQQRSAVTAIRLAEWQRLRHLRDECPVMLIDDVGIGLDGTRRRALLEQFSELGQVFITTTEANPWEEFAGEKMAIKIRAGEQQE